jgi:hypothetical protein
MHGDPAPMRKMLDELIQPALRIPLGILTGRAGGCRGAVNRTGYPSLHEHA